MMTALNSKADKSSLGSAASKNTTEFATAAQGAKADSALQAADLEDLDVASVSGAAPLASPVFTGEPTAPTAAPGTATDRLATTAFVSAALEGLIAVASDSPSTVSTLWVGPKASLPSTKDPYTIYFGTGA